MGLVGYGLAGRVFHAPLITHTPGLELAAVVTSDPDRAAQARRQAPDALVTPDVGRLLAGDGRVDVLVVATANVAHVPLASRAVDAGIPTVVDKPLAPTATEARRLVVRAEQAGTLLTVFHNRRWDNDFRTVHQLLDDRRLGDVHRFESRFERWAPRLRPASWREDPDPAQGAGLLLDLGSHLVDQALVLFGPVTEVAAEMDRRRPGSAVDDDVFLALTHASGVRSHLWASAVAARPGPRFRVLGSSAGFTRFGLDPQEQQLRDGLHPGSPGWGLQPAQQDGTLGVEGSAEPVPTLPGAYQAFYAGLVDALDGSAPPPVDPWEAATVLDVLEAARLAAAGRTVVRLGAPSS